MKIPYMLGLFYFLSISGYCLNCGYLVMVTIIFPVYFNVFMRIESSKLFKSLLFKQKFLYFLGFYEARRAPPLEGKKNSH